MLPSVWAMTLSGHRDPQSMAHQKSCTLILPVARSTDTSAMPAIGVLEY